ncbi:S-adenosylmethionine:tRNA ribosyltransferase-isomerase [Niabella terrae]
MDPRKIDIKDFSYALPAERIAFRPLEQRDASRLLIYRQGRISEESYRHLDRQIPPGALMIFNNTKVVEARLLFRKPTGGQIEVFCLEPDASYPDLTTAMATQQQVDWVCLVGGAAKWDKTRPLYLEFTIDGKNWQLEARYLEKKGDSYRIRLNWEAPVSFAELLHHAGHVPLPPYIKRPDEQMDQTRYQTVFALHDGSVAAPTAGLHFTERVLDQLRQRGVLQDFVTLHVGAGTFKPVKAATMQDHEMHAEFIEVDQSLIEKLLDRGKDPVIAVGTTSMRTLESLYWLGVALLEDPQVFDGQMPFVNQWAPYGNHATMTTAVALEALRAWMHRTGKEKLLASTRIIIAPGYRFKIVNGLLTNFHQPASTLLLLVAAFIGADWKSVYDHALQQEFRFLSYGDGCLLWPPEDADSPPSGDHQTIGSRPL